jgi:hypothetical protein
LQTHKALAVSPAASVPAQSETKPDAQPESEAIPVTNTATLKIFNIKINVLKYK